MRGTDREHLDAGDHVAFVLTPFDGECRAIEEVNGAQLGFQAVRDIEAGQPA